MTPFSYPPTNFSRTTNYLPRMSPRGNYITNYQFHFYSSKYRRTRNCIDKTQLRNRSYHLHIRSRVIKIRTYTLTNDVIPFEAFRNKYDDFVFCTYVFILRRRGLATNRVVPKKKKTINVHADGI